MLPRRDGSPSERAPSALDPRPRSVALRLARLAAEKLASPGSNPPPAASSVSSLAVSSDACTDASAVRAALERGRACVASCARARARETPGTIRRACSTPTKISPPPSKTSNAPRPSPTPPRGSKPARGRETVPGEGRARLRLPRARGRRASLSPSPRASLSPLPPPLSGSRRRRLEIWPTRFWRGVVFVGVSPRRRRRRRRARTRRVSARGRTARRRSTPKRLAEEFLVRAGRGFRRAEDDAADAAGRTEGAARALVGWGAALALRGRLARETGGGDGAGAAEAAALRRRGLAVPSRARAPGARASPSAQARSHRDRAVGRVHVRRRARRRVPRLGRRASIGCGGVGGGGASVGEGDRRGRRRRAVWRRRERLVTRAELRATRRRRGWTRRARGTPPRGERRRARRRSEEGGREGEGEGPRVSGRRDGDASVRPTRASLVPQFCVTRPRAYEYARVNFTLRINIKTRSFGLTIARRRRPTRFSASAAALRAHDLAAIHTHSVARTLCTVPARWLRRTSSRSSSRPTRRRSRRTAMAWRRWPARRTARAR